MIIPKWRASFGFCPSCNSDAPELDSCPICCSYHSANGDPFPPPKELQKQWINHHQGAIEIKYQINNAVAEARRKRKIKSSGN